VFNHYMNNLAELNKKLEQSEVKAREIARSVLSKVRSKLGY
jgi:tryptophanyl-tRNA synthetase